MTATDRATDRSPIVQRSRTRSAQQQKVIIDAARRLIAEKGASFTTQELIKEAGIALQTFYRHFAGKDQLLLAVIENVIAEAAATLEEQARELPDPIARLHFYVTGSLSTVATDDGNFGPRFVTAEHWRLHQLFPDEIGEATQPFADIVERALREAADAGLLHPTDPAHDAWFAMKLVMSVFHHYAFATVDERIEDIAEHLWSFCLAAFGGGPASRASHDADQAPRGS
jgi:TetR/AcrR family transcriptional regulator